MARVTTTTLRLGQKAVKSANPLFNGNLSIQMLPVDVKRLTFQANITAETGDVNNPSYTYTPCDDVGRPRTFSDIDDVLKWINGAYVDIISVAVEIADYDVVTKKFVPPSDPIVDATKQKATFERLRDAQAPKVASVNAKVAAAAASGWNAETAHPALKANYDELVFQQQATQNIYNFYVAEVARYNAIITG